MQPDGSWRQILWVDPGQPPQYNNLGVGADFRSLREEVHRVMGAELDTAKHHQRRKKDGLPKAVDDRITEHRSRRAARARGHYEELLRDRYLLGKS
jgi:hypothetical protein